MQSWFFKSLITIYFFSYQAVATSCEVLPNKTIEFKEFEEKLTSSFPSFIEKCRDSYPELSPFLSTILSAIKKKPIQFKCSTSDFSAMVFLDGNTTNHTVFWNINELLEEKILPISKDFYGKIRYQEVLLHELLHFYDIQSTSDYRHNTKKFQVFSNKKRFNKVTVPDNNLDSIYLLSAACAISQDRSISLDGPILHDYAIKYSTSQKRSFVDLCSKSLMKANKNRTIFQTPESIGPFCKKMNQMLNERSVAHTFDFESRFGGEEHIKINECDSVDDKITCILNKKNASQVPIDSQSNEIKQRPSSKKTRHVK